MSFNESQSGRPERLLKHKMTEVCQTSSPVSADPGEVMKIETQIMCMSFRPPLFDDKIFKDECMYCFKTPLDADGLFICLERFAGFCIDHVLIYCKRTARKAFLWYKQTKVLLTKSEEPEDKVTKLALGVEGGFSSGLQFRLVDEYAVIICPMFHIKVSLSRLPPKTQEVCQKIIDDEGVRRQEALEAGVSVWEGDERKNTLHLNLKQEDNGKRIPPRGWKCEEEGCDLRENLWMNLTDGAIMCGRSQYVQEGVMSKGQNHARLHFDLTGYPLVVKLGTITKDDADVFSYDEDCSVRDPNLKKHLKHFGIDMDKAEKTEKSTLEMELDLNQKWEWEMCQEDGANLELAYGPGLTGIINIGSSCYISASLQLLLQIPDFVNIYGTEFEKHYLNVPILDSHTDFNCQTAKVFSSLLSGEFSKKDGICNGIKPTQFRKIVSRGNAEFSSMRQQDADEYLRLLFDRVDEFLKDPKPVDAVRFKLEERLKDNASNRIRYSYTDEVVLSLNVPEKTVIEAAGPVKTDAPVRPTVSFAECLSATFGEQAIDDFQSPVTGEVKGGVVQHRIATFPDYLIIQMKKFALTPDYNVKKLDVNVEMPNEIDLKAFRGHGKQPEEVLLPHQHAKSQLTLGRPRPGIDSDVFRRLCRSGITPEAARRAIHVSGNSGFDSALDWIMHSVGDRDINEEHPDLQSESDDVDGYAIEQLVHLGFSIYQARYALQRVHTGVNDAAEWLFSNADSIPPEQKNQEIKDYFFSVDVPKKFRDGSGRYHLIGFISHMGSSPFSGHYVAHMKKDSKWYLFNDEKVAISQNPPIFLGYIYLYKRVDESEH